MKNKMIIQELKIQELDLLGPNENSLSEYINEIQTEKSNILYIVLRNQYIEWKNILINVLSSSNNKSIVLYIMFLIVEIHIKAECVKEFNISNFNDEIQNVTYKAGRSYFSLRQIGHNLNYFFKTVIGSSTNSKFTNFTGLLEIQDKLEALELSDTIKTDYMSLRYNCNLNGEFLCPENLIDENETVKIKEVINNVF